MGWNRYSDRKAAAHIFQKKAGIALLLLSNGLIVAGLAGCRNPAAKNVSEPFVSLCTVTPAILKANTCLNFVKGPQSKCFLRLHGYTASDDVLKGAEVELGSWRGTPDAHQAYMQKRVEGGVNPIEMRSLTYYANAGYRYMNSGLRGDFESLSENMNSIYSAASALNKMKKFEGEVYRTENVDLSMLDSIHETLKVGNLVIEETFLSTSKRSDLVFAAPGPELHITYKIQSKTARDLKYVTGNEAEAEVLFLPGSVFRVQSIKQVVEARRASTPARPVYGTSLKIEMEEVEI